MNKFDFGEEVARLEENFETLTDKRRDILFEKFSGWPAGFVRRAVDLLLLNHPYRRFPLPIEFRRALEVAYQESSRATFEELEKNCQKCDNQGHVVVGIETAVQQPQALPCTCWRGQKIKFADQERQRKKLREIRPRDLGYPEEFDLPAERR